VIFLNVGVSMLLGRQKTRLEESREVLERLSLVQGMPF